MQTQTSPANQRVVIELRYYRMRNGRQVERTTEYLRRGLLPASERAGIRPVGCFNAVFAPDSPFILTLASYPSLAALETAREKLAASARAGGTACPTGAKVVACSVELS